MSICAKTARRFSPGHTRPILSASQERFRRLPRMEWSHIIKDLKKGKVAGFRTTRCEICLSGPMVWEAFDGTELVNGFDRIQDQGKTEFARVTPWSPAGLGQMKSGSTCADRGDRIFLPNGRATPDVPLSVAVDDRSLGLCEPRRPRRQTGSHRRTACASSRQRSDHVRQGWQVTEPA